MRASRSVLLALALALSVAFPAAQTRTAKTLDIYVVDVEGGNATLFVSPSGESVASPATCWAPQLWAGVQLTVFLTFASMAVALVIGLVLAPRPTRLVASVFTSLALSDFLQVAYKSAEPFRS